MPCPVISRCPEDALPLLAYARHGSARFAMPGQLAAEEALLAAAVERRAHQFNAEQGDAVVARFTPPVLADRLK